jgi:NADPH:quinone reductase-like Zn-dependent oxidoreductase
MNIPSTMKAACRERYGPADVLSIQDVAVPTPSRGEILVRVKAATVNRTDAAILHGKPWVMRLFTGVFKPRHTTTGTDFAGQVVAVGEGVTRFVVGDRVMGFDDTGLQSHAQFLAIAASKPITTTPASLDDAQAAACCEGVHYAVNFLNKVELRAGQQVLINGASGAIGSALVQLCRARDVEATAVCTAQTMDRVRALGAHHVLDHAREDFTAGTGRYHFVFDAVGKSTFSRCRPVLRPKGVYISSELGPGMQNPPLALVTPLLLGKKVVFPVPLDVPASLAVVKQLAERGQFTPLLDRSYPLSQISQAYQYVESGQKVGNVTLSMEG